MYEYCKMLAMQLKLYVLRGELASFFLLALFIYPSYHSFVRNTVIRTILFRIRSLIWYILSENQEGVH